MPTAKAGFDDGPRFTGRAFLHFMGPTLPVQMGFDPDYSSQGGAAVLPSEQYPAIIDTGATHSCIDSELASRLGMLIVDRGPTSGIHGTMQVNYHFGQIHVPALGFTVHGRFAGVNLAAGGQPHLAILGRDFLRHFTMNYDGRTGAVTISND